MLVKVVIVVLIPVNTVYIHSYCSHVIIIIIISWHLAAQEVGWFDKPENSSGAIAGRLSTDTLHIRGAVGDRLGLVIQNLVTIIAAYVIAFTAGWKITLVITATVPLLGIGAWIGAKFQMGFSSTVYQHMSFSSISNCIATHVLVFTAGWKITLVITATVPLLGIGACIGAKFQMGFSSLVHQHMSSMAICIHTHLQCLCMSYNVYTDYCTRMGAFTNEPCKCCSGQQAV